MGDTFRLVAAATALLTAACCGTVPETLRRHSYPPSFNYVPHEDLHSAMWQLAHDTYELDRILRESASGGGYPREEILSLLAGMDEAARSLGPGGWPANHPQIGANVDLLRQDIERARQAAERNPPNYFYAGAVSGACLYCHASRP